MQATLVIFTVLINGAAGITHTEQHATMQKCLDRMVAISLAPLTIHHRVRKIESLTGECKPNK